MLNLLVDKASVNKSTILLFFLYICKQFVSNFLVNVLFDYIFFTDLEIPDDKTGITVYVPLLCVDMSFCQSDNAIASDS